jgi:hypothetical protein
MWLVVDGLRNISRLLLCCGSCEHVFRPEIFRERTAPLFTDIGSQPYDRVRHGVDI